MSIVLELRDHVLHSGGPLVHPTSEDVVLSNVFGVVKNLPSNLVFVPWLRAVTQMSVADSSWKFEFWEKQGAPVGIIEGPTVVDLIVESDTALVFAEVKMDAPASPGPVHDPNRNQLVRNLDIGYRRAAQAGKEFALIFVTPDASKPSLIGDIHNSGCQFPVNAGIPPSTVLSCLHWASWATVGDVVAAAYSQGEMGNCDGALALDLLAYLAKKRLWENRLADSRMFYSDELYRSLRRKDSPFIPYAKKEPTSAL
jgi:hypothetical protein